MKSVETLVPGRELAWLGGLFVPGLFDGRHRFALEDIGAAERASIRRRTNRHPRTAHGFSAGEDGRGLH
jgi:hypothetical protein